MKRAAVVVAASDDDSPLTPWEQEQLAFQPGLRKRLREELEAIHRRGSLVSAFEGHTDLLTHLLAYAWRSTNALMRTCKRFHAIIQGRDYWKALAVWAFADRVPRAVVEQVNWFHGLSADEVPYSYLWSCVLSSKSPGWGLPRWFKAQHNTLVLTHFRADDLGMFRRVLRLRWKRNQEGATYWYSMATFSIAADRGTRAGAYEMSSTPWIPVYVTYFGHPRLRRRIFVAQEHEILGITLDDEDDDDPKPVINCYNEVWDPVTRRIWCGECPLMVREMDDESGYLTWLPHQDQNWGTWVQPESDPLNV